MSQVAAESGGINTQPILRWGDGHYRAEQDSLAVEMPVALEFNGVSHAVMLATPCDLESFALGFALSEGIVASRSEFLEADVDESALGITVHCRITAGAFMRLKQRRRNLSGRTGCGLCGLESLAQVMRELPAVPSGQPFAIAALYRALQQLADLQPLNRLTGATHAAAWSTPDGLLRQVCEDAGRHNALDKLIGKLAQRRADFSSGFLLITSRASVEMVQKAASVGIASLVAISAPTALAVTTAQMLNMTLLGFARGKEFVAYAHGERVAGAN